MWFAAAAATLALLSSPRLTSVACVTLWLGIGTALVGAATLAIRDGQDTLALGSLALAAVPVSIAAVVCFLGRGVAL